MQTSPWQTPWPEQFCGHRCDGRAGLSQASPEKPGITVSKDEAGTKNENTFLAGALSVDALSHTGATSGTDSNTARAVGASIASGTQARAKSTDAMARAVVGTEVDWVGCNHLRAVVTRVSSSASTGGVSVANTRSRAPDEFECEIDATQVVEHARVGARTVDLGAVVTTEARVAFTHSVGA